RFVAGRRVREDKNIARREFHSLVLSNAFAQSLRLPAKHNAFSRVRAYDLIRAVGRAVGGDDNFDLVFWILQLERVGDFSSYVTFFVVSCDDDGNFGRDVGAAHGP